MSELPEVHVNAATLILRSGVCEELEAQADALIFPVITEAATYADKRAFGILTPWMEQEWMRRHVFTGSGDVGARRGMVTRVLNTRQVWLNSVSGTGTTSRGEDCMTFSSVHVVPGAADKYAARTQRALGD